MKYKLESICLKITDGSHYSPSNDTKGNIPMLSVKDMEEFDFNYDKCKHISKEEFDKMLKNDLTEDFYWVRLITFQSEDLFMFTTVSLSLSLLLTHSLCG